MYFCTYVYDNIERVGVLAKDKNSVIPMDSLLGIDVPSMNDFLDMDYEPLVERLRGEVESHLADAVPLDQVILLAPIPYPKQDILCLGKNYLAHAKELSGSIFQDDKLPQYPIYFSKRARPAIGTGSTIYRNTEATEKTDYEVELAVVIGKGGANISPEDVEKHIFGYTIVNDVSARDVQNQHTQWYRGKSLDTYCPMGPWITYASEISFPPELTIQSRVNGEVRQNDNTKNMIFSITHVISELSQGITLQSGDIIITGTPAGVGLGYNPPKFLQLGDTIECEIEGIGTLVNTVK